MVRAQEDEVARQRRKHWDETLQRPVRRFPATTLGDVLSDLLEAAAAADDSFDVTAFLTEQGHTTETVHALRQYLCLEVEPDPEGAGPGCTVVRWPPAGSRERALARIRALLIDD